MTDQQTILSTLGFESLTPMQETMSEAAGKNNGVVLLSPTGTGKTLAYLLPMLQAIENSLDSLQAVVIVPTRELAAQSENMLKMTKSGVRSISLYGGRPAMQEHRVINELKPQVVFATPGRLNDHLDKGNIRPDSVTTLIIDEFDKCLELGFQEEMERAVSHFHGLRHCWLMSATDAEAIPAFMGKVIRGYVRLDFLGEAEELASRVAIRQVLSPEKDKLETLGRLLTHINGKPAIVFVAHRESAERVQNWLKERGFFSVMYHGGLEQDVRERALYKFRNGSANVLVSTDLAARGLDIPEVSAVVHYHLPLKAEEFTHRNGRTARWNTEGTVFLITGPTETLPPFVSEAVSLELAENNKRPVAPRFSTIYIGRGKSDKLSKSDVLGFLCKKGGLRASDIGRIDVGAHAAYVAVPRVQLKNVLRLVAGEKIKGMKTIIEESKR